MNKLLEEDFLSIYKNNADVLEFKGRSVLITGATGLIGSLLIKFFLFCNEKFSLDVTVYALIRNKEKAEIVFGGENKNLKFIYADLLNDQIKVEDKIDYIIHTASITDSYTLKNNPVETLNTTFYGTDKILSLAKALKIRSMVYISSMEVYGEKTESGKTFEDGLGRVDLENLRSSYPEGKRAAELLCNSYCFEYGVPVKRARLAQTFGAGVNKNDKRVFMQFALSALSGEDIILHTDGESEGNYVYTSDCISAILTILVRGKNGEAYNVSNEDCHMRIIDMANLVASKITKGKIKVVFDIPENDKYGYAPKTKLFLSTQKIKSLGWKPYHDLKDAYIRLMDYIKD